MNRQSTKQATKPLWLKTINARTDDKIFSAFALIKYLKEQIQENKNKDQMIQFIDKWTTKKFTATLTRDDSTNGRLELAFIFNGKNKYKIQGRFTNNAWLWTMADFGDGDFKKEYEEFFVFNTIFQILLNKFLKNQKLNSKAMKLDLD